MAPTIEIVKEENPAVDALCLQGYGFYFYDVDPNTSVCPSETWILPIIPLGVMIVYAAIAIFFYNSDVWFHIVYV